MSNRDALDNVLTDRIDELVERAVEQGDAPGVVAGLARGEATHVSTAGAMAVGGEPMRPDTLFRIASITKPISAVAVLSLVEDGLLELDGPVDALAPELADRRVLRDPAGPLDDTVPANRPVTVRDLLTFTWGFGLQGAMFAGEPWPVVAAGNERELQTFGPPQPGATPAPDVWMERLGELPLLVQPGERWLYNTGSQVLGVLASRAVGAPFEEVLRERVLEPLGMRDTAFFAADPSRFATFYQRQDGELRVQDPPDGQWSSPPAFADAAAGLVSSVDDVLAFGRMLLSGGDPVLSAGAVAEMTRDHLTDEQRSKVWPGFDLLQDRGWGYGVSVLEDGAYTWDGGTGTTWMNIPSKDLSVVVLTQRAPDENGWPAVLSEVTAAARDLA